MFLSRKSGVQITDRRVRLTSEVRVLYTFQAHLDPSLKRRSVAQVLQGIRLVKFYAWEAFYAHRIGKLREDEVAKIRRIAYVI